MQQNKLILWKHPEKYNKQTEERLQNKLFTDKPTGDGPNAVFEKLIRTETCNAH